MPKVLICASTLIHIKNFHIPYLKFFKELGYEVHVAVPKAEPVDYVDCIHEIAMAKRIISPKNLGAVLAMRRLVKSNQIDLLMTHAALAGIIGRTAVLFKKSRPKVIHTSHGYFFWKGSGILRKILFYTPEWLLRGVTDCVVTMNEEDSIAAKKLVRKGGLAVKVPGMGVDASRFNPATDEEKKHARHELLISDDSYVMVYAAEFSKRKNHIELIHALAEIKKSVPEVLLLLCGSGKLQPQIESMVNQLGLNNQIRFLGWCSQMEKIYKACDLAVSTSKCEGLPFNIIEAQLCGLPVVASRIRGHTDLIGDGETGWCYTPGNFKDLTGIVIKIIRNSDRGKSQGTAARKSAGSFTLNNVYKENTDVYREMM